METMTDFNEVTSVPAASEKTPAKRRKRRTKAQIARDQKRKAAQSVKPAVTAASMPVPEPLPKVQFEPAPKAPSPAVIALQSQVVGLVDQRSAARQKLTQAHAEYLSAQSRFQASQGELQGIEQEVQYRIGLIAQLENRAPQSPVLNFPSQETTAGYPMGNMTGVSVEPTPAQRGHVATSDPNDMVNRGHSAALRAAL